MRQRGKAVKARRNKTVTLKRRSAPKVAPRRKLSAADANEKITLLEHRLNEALEQQAATSEVLRVISSSPSDLKPVFDTILANATQLCDAKFGSLYRCEGDTFQLVSTHGLPPDIAADLRRAGPRRPPPNTTALGRLAATKRTAHIADALSELGDLDPPPGFTGASLVKLAGARTVLGVPLLKQDELVGAIIVYRTEVRAFTDKQVELLTNFADQAVIAIENTRLLNELRKSLQQQTATADLLKVISSSPGELEPVFDALLKNATEICEAKFGILTLYEGKSFRVVAMHNAPSAFAELRRREPVMRAGPLMRVASTKQMVHIPDLQESVFKQDEASAAFAVLAGVRTVVVVPMLKEGELVGTIGIYRQEVRPFSDKQLELLSNFAAQAVIAIENTRLLKELRQRTNDLSESLEQQTATSEVLQVISSSPGDLEPVFQAMLENATRICEAKFGVLFRYENGVFHAAAMLNAPQALAEFHRNSRLISATGWNSARSSLKDRRRDLHRRRGCRIKSWRAS